MATSEPNYELLAAEYVIRFGWEQLFDRGIRRDRTTVPIREELDWLRANLAYGPDEVRDANRIWSGRKFYLLLEEIVNSWILAAGHSLSDGQQIVLDEWRHDYGPNGKYTRGKP